MIEIDQQRDTGVARRGAGDPRAWWVGVAVTTAVTLGFFLLFWNRFAGIRSGLGGFGGGMAILQGKMPYRDYFTASPPLFGFTSAMVLKLFGGAVIVTRGFGVFERLVISILVYAWLSRFFTARHSLIASIVTMIASAGDLSDPVSSYNYETIMWVIASGYAASFALDWDNATMRRTRICAFLSGFLAGLSFATKQTMGLGATLCIPFVVSLCLLRMTTIRRAFSFVILFAAGWAAAGGSLLLWLSHLGIVHEFLTDVFLKGPAAKGKNAGEFLSRHLLVALALWIPAAMGIAGMLLSWPALCRSSAGRQERQSDSSRTILFLALLYAGCIALGVLLSYAGAQMMPLTPFAMYFEVAATAALMMFYGWKGLQGHLFPRDAQFCLLATVSFVTAFMASLSFPLFEAMLLPGIGFLIAACLDGFDGLRRFVVYVACGALLATHTCIKLTTPFGFDGFNEPPVFAATQPSTVPELRGLRLPPEIVQFIDGTARIVSEHSTPADTIFTYPEMSIFYPITHRHPPTVSGSHNIDVVNDDFARQEARRLLAGRPAVLIYWRQPEKLLRFDEVLWRGGRRSGQREIIQAMDALASQYRPAAAYTLTPDDIVVNVYTRQ